MNASEETTEVSLGYEPRWYQAEVDQKLRRFSVIVWHRRAGKTIFAILNLIHTALACKKPEPICWFIAPLLKQAREAAWTYLKRYTRPIPGVKVNESDLSVTFPHNNGVIRIKGADDPDSLRGSYLDAVVFDEVAQIKPDTWGEVVRPMLMDRRGGALFIGTPKGVNLFSKLYYAALANPRWTADLRTVDDTHILDEGEIEEAKRTMSPSQIEQELYCDFQAATTDSLIQMAVARSAADRVLNNCDFDFAPRILGVDVARFGDDRSVIMMRQGLRVADPVIIHGIDNMGLVGRILELMDRHNPDAVFIDAGAGAGVIDRLRQLGRSVIEVPFGGTPINQRYANKRAEMWCEMSAWLNAGGSIPKREDLIADLCTPKYDYAGRTGKFELESKDEIRARSLPSPDLGDALALTFAYPVRPKVDARGMPLPDRSHALTEYDPLYAEEETHGRS